MKAEKTRGANGYWLVRALWVGPTGTTMLHTHEVEGSSPPVSTSTFLSRTIQRICVTVAHRTLTPFAGVRIPHPLPKDTQPHPWLGVFYLMWIRTDQMRYAGGISLPPVQKLVASLIFACKSRQKCYRISHPLPLDSPWIIPNPGVSFSLHRF